jgi:hypothetical protein
MKKASSWNADEVWPQEHPIVFDRYSIVATYAVPGVVWWGGYKHTPVPLVRQGPALVQAWSTCHGFPGLRLTGDGGLSDD